MPHKVICPVCGKYEFEHINDYDICKSCGWENEEFFEEGGVNKLSLSDFQKRYKIYVYLNPKYSWQKNGYPELTAKERCTYWHQYSVSNRQSVLSSKQCGCFFCKKIFDSNLVSEHYINDKDGATSVCPFCGVDSLLPDNSVELSTELLDVMYQVWFGW